MSSDILITWPDCHSPDYDNIFLPVSLKNRPLSERTHNKFMT